jgi:outer membrane lipoprotein-sorting protein
MSPITRTITALTVCSMLIAAAPAWAADPTGPEILAKVDQALNAFKDAIFESKLRVKQPNGESREFGFTTYQKVPDKRLVRFTSPGDIKGMGVLVESRETIYVFLPGFQKVRRMGTHVKNQTFMGSDFSFEDMSQTSYAPSYDPKLVGQDERSWILELAAKPGQDLEFPRIKLWADKGHFQPTRLEYYDAGGKKLKTQERSDFKKDSSDHYQPGRVVVTDHRRNDHSSEIVFVNTTINPGLKDDLFSVRSLQRGQ